MKICLVGLPNSGKTTLFNALTKSEVEVTQYSTKGEPNVSVVDVLDERVTKLSQMYLPKKTIHATIEIIDFAGVSKGTAKDGVFSPDLMTLAKNTDAMALVIRNFSDDLSGTPDPLGDINAIDEELLLSDLISTEKRLEKVKVSLKKGQKTTALQFEEKVLQKVLDQLNNSQPIRDLELSKEDEKIIRGFQFFTQKPVLIILNSDETNVNKNDQLITEISKFHDVLEVAGKFEMELSTLNDEEAEVFMEDIGITESVRSRLTTRLYKLLGYISFFTVGKDEVRAWNIIMGDTALAAAAAIHSDLARGFIRAECFTYSDLILLGSEKKVKEMGKFRLEGKGYVVQNGDILNIRFNV